jgi:AcrR family transcriptional regulator
MLEKGMEKQSDEASEAIRSRLLKAALECFLADEYQAVTTRQIAGIAGANVSMISYYFGGKEGLFEEMIRDTLAPLLEVLDGELLSSAEGFGEYLRLYYRTMSRHPRFPKLILKVLALNQGPGRGFIKQLLERRRGRYEQRVDDLKARGEVASDLEPDMLRIAFVSLAMTPMLLKEVFEEQSGEEMDAAFLDRLADFNSHLFARGLSNKREQ